MQMIKEITFYYPKGNNETYEVGRVTPEGTVESIDISYISYARAIILFENNRKVIVGIPFEYTEAGAAF
jgi:hypothetical protein